jgi:ClpX C4-type zinc finger protein
MWRRTNRADVEPLSCSFCRKTQDAVQKLISSPSDDVRVFICDECVSVCQSILEDDRRAKEAGSTPEVDKVHPPLDGWFVSQLVGAVERWIKKESSGDDAAREFEEMRRWAICLIPNEDHT